MLSSLVDSSSRRPSCSAGRALDEPQTPCYAVGHMAVLAVASLMPGEGVATLESLVAYTLAKLDPAVGNGRPSAGRGSSPSPRRTTWRLGSESAARCPRRRCPAHKPAIGQRLMANDVTVTLTGVPELTRDWARLHQAEPGRFQAEQQPGANRRPRRAAELAHHHRRPGGQPDLTRTLKDATFTTEGAIRPRLLSRSSTAGWPTSGPISPGPLPGPGCARRQTEPSAPSQHVVAQVVTGFALVEPRLTRKEPNIKT